MPWTQNNYTDAMKNLPAGVRNKAIEISNALIEEKEMNEGIAISTGISRAKDWAANRWKKTDDPEKSHISDLKIHGEDRYVIPYEGKKWAIKAEGQPKARRLFSSKKEAIAKAREEAKEFNGSLFRKGLVRSSKEYHTIPIAEPLKQTAE